MKFKVGVIIVVLIWVGACALGGMVLNSMINTADLIEVPQSTRPPRPIPPAPTWTVTPATAPIQEIDNLEFIGQGDNVVVFDGPIKKGVVVRATHDGERLFMIEARGEDQKLIGLPPVNTRGVHDATALIPSGTMYLVVTADGNWTVKSE